MAAIAPPQKNGLRPQHSGYWDRDLCIVGRAQLQKPVREAWRLKASIAFKRAGKRVANMDGPRSLEDATSRLETSRLAPGSQVVFPPQEEAREKDQK